MNSRLPRLVFGVLTVGAAIYFSWSYPKLPEVVASHFNAHGVANGWQAKPTFFVLFLVPLCLAAILVFEVPLIIQALPAPLINLPHKNQRLSPALRSESLNFAGTWFAWFGCAVLPVIILTFDYAVQSNIDPAHPPNPAGMWYIPVAFGIFTLVWMVRFLKKFLLPPESQSG